MTAEGTALAAYRAGADGWDEFAAPTGLRPEQDILATTIGTLGLEGLLSARRELASLVREEGVLYGESGRNWTIDPLPLILSAAHWERLDAGLTQRARLLGLILSDIYGEQRLLASGAIPPEVVWGHRGFLHQACGVPVPRDNWLPLIATDLGRDGDGVWTAIGDRTGTPAGAGYAMANRRLTSRVMGDLHRDARPARLRTFFAAVRTALQRLAPREGTTPRGVLLWAGASDPTAYEQGFIATLLGYGLVEAEDLVLRDGRVWINSPDGRVPIDVILRRVASELSDPLEFRSDSQAGLAGLLEATRLGNVVCVNPLGSGVLENPAILGLLPRLAPQLLGEELILPSAATWWCGEPSALSHVLAHADQLYLKPVDRSAAAIVRGWELTSAELDGLLTRIKAQPWAWCAQVPVDLSTVPVVADDGLEARRMVLRTFGVQVDKVHEFLPGGLARVQAVSEGSIGGAERPLAKDVWVLGSDDAGEGWQATYERGSLIIEHPTSVAPRVADNLVWLGRYAERTDSSSRILRRALDLAFDHGSKPESRGGQVLKAVLSAAERITSVDLGSDDPASAHHRIRAAVHDPKVTGSVAHSVSRLAQAAHQVPDLMSDDIWRILSRLEDGVEAAGGQRDLASVLDGLVDSTLALSGINAESLTRDATWAFLDAGVRTERAQRILSLVEHTLGRERAVIVEQQLVDAVAEIAESLITHRRRAASGPAQRQPALALTYLLVADPTNPRSVAFQIDRLAEGMRLVGDDALSARIVGLADTVSSLDLAALFETGRPALARALADLRGELRGIADEMGRTHLTRSGPRRAVITGWEDEQ